MERFERFRFSVPAVPLRRGFLCASVQFSREDGSGSGFGSWKTVPAVPVPRSVPGKTVPTVPVSGSGSVPGPAGKITRIGLKELIPAKNHKNYWARPVQNYFSNSFGADCIRRAQSTPILLKGIAVHPPFVSLCFCKSMPSSWQKVVYMPPICIAIRLPFVSRYA